MDSLRNDLGSPADSRRLIGSRLAVAASAMVALGLVGCSDGDGESTSTPREDVATSTTSFHTLEVGGRERSYRLHVPSSLPAGPAPLLIALHGGGGSSEQFAANSGFDAVAESGRFLVVYPEGIPSPRLRKAHTWNGGYCCGPAQQEGVDDVAFVSEVIDEVAAAHPVDPARVFAVGHSNGGIMAYRLACELGDRVVAIGVVAGSLGVDHCTPDQPVSLLHVHGTADQNHPIEGGSGKNSLAGVEFHAAIDAVRSLAAANGCPGGPSTSTEGDLTTQKWSPCAGGAEVDFVVIEGASHAWPGGAGGVKRLVGPTYMGYDASAQLWRFLSAHPRES